MEKYFEIGQIVNTNGLKGNLKIKPFTDDITIFERLHVIYIQKEGILQEFKIQRVMYNKNMVIIKLEGIDSIEEAEKYRNFYVKINKEDEEELPENVYYIVDLIECEVYTEEGLFLGIIIDVLQTGSNDVYIVKNKEEKEVLLPAIAEVIREVDIQKKKITVRLLKGLI